MKLAACRRLEEVLVERDAERDANRDAVSVASLQQHLQSCQDCRRHQQTWALVRQSALAANDVLDDLTSARVFGRVRARLDLEAAQAGRSEQRHDRRTRPRPGRFAWSLAFAAVTILAFVLGTRLRRQEPGLVMAPMALEPYAMRVLAEPRTTVSAKGLEHLTLPPHASLRARLGPAADLSLFGPLELNVRDGEKQRVDLDLRTGTLLADFDGSGGRSLRISTPDATVDIVGTRFIVDATAARTRVAVDHGRVRVESKGRVRMVGSGFSWSTDQDALIPLDGELARLFDGTALEASREDAGKRAAATSRGAATSSAAAKSTGTRIIRGEGKSRGAGRSRAGVPARLPPPGRVIASRSTTGSEPTTTPTPTATATLKPTATPTTPTMPTAPLEEVAPDVVPPPSSTPPAVPPVPAPARPATSRTTVSSLYKEAEVALRRGDDAAGKEHLAELASRFPHDAMADSARFELALLAHKDGNQREALTQLRKILSRGTSGPFVEPASFLRCRVYLEEDRAAAETCLVRFVRDYPQSPHDDVAVRALIDLSRAKGQCSKASSFAEMYLQRHPTGPFAEEAARVRSHCAQ